MPRPKRRPKKPKGNNGQRANEFNFYDEKDKKTGLMQPINSRKRATRSGKIFSPEKSDKSGKGDDNVEKKEEEPPKKKRSTRNFVTDSTKKFESIQLPKICRRRKPKKTSNVDGNDTEEFSDKEHQPKSPEKGKIIFTYFYFICDRKHEMKIEIMKSTYCCFYISVININNDFHDTFSSQEDIEESFTTKMTKVKRCLFEDNEDKKSEDAFNERMEEIPVVNDLQIFDEIFMETSPGSGGVIDLICNEQIEDIEDERLG